MKRGVLSRCEMVTHEAGHLVAIAGISGLSAENINWRRVSGHELAHCEPALTRTFDWCSQTGRNDLIARRAAVALAGGAAVEAVSDRGSETVPSLRDIHTSVGAVDFELAHEWLTLQRYDPDQRSLEREIQRLYTVIRRHLRLAAQQEATLVVSQRIAERLMIADSHGSDTADVPAGELLAGLRIQVCEDIRLEHTLK